MCLMYFDRAITQWREFGTTKIESTGKILLLDTHEERYILGGLFFHYIIYSGLYNM